MSGIQNTPDLMEGPEEGQEPFASEVDEASYQMFEGKSRHARTHDRLAQNELATYLTQYETIYLASRGLKRTTKEDKQHG